MAITTDDFNKIWASESPLTPYSFSASQYKEGWNFIGGTPPSRQMWDFLQKQNDEKLEYLLNNFDDYAKKTDLDDYLPLSGGTVTGDLTVTGTLDGTASGNLPLSGGTVTGDLTVTGTLDGTASGNLPLSGGTLTGDVDITEDLFVEGTITGNLAGTSVTTGALNVTGATSVPTVGETDDSNTIATTSFVQRAMRSAIVTKLAQTTTIPAITALQTNSWFGQLLKFVLDASGVRYLIAENGYVCLGSFFGGLIIQWGNSNGNKWNDFPIAFSSFAKVICTCNNKSWAWVSGLSETGFSFMANDSGFWLAIGM